MATAITLTATAVGGDAVTGFTVATQPTNGVLTGIAPNLTYTPNADFNSSDSFTFTASATSAPAAVSITVDPVDDNVAPVFTNEPYAVLVSSAATAGAAVEHTVTIRVVSADGRIFYNGFEGN